MTDSGGCQESPQQRPRIIRLVVVWIPLPQDILCGRGQGCYNHSGNRRMLQLVQPYKQDYEKAQKSVKRHIAAHVEGQLRSNGARFLSRRTKREPWSEVSTDEAYKKITHCLRERGPSSKNKVPPCKHSTTGKNPSPNDHDCRSSEDRERCDPHHLGRTTAVLPEQQDTQDSASTVAKRGNEVLLTARNYDHCDLKRQRLIDVRGKKVVIPMISCPPLDNSPPPPRGLLRSTSAGDLHPAPMKTQPRMDDNSSQSLNLLDSSKEQHNGGGDRNDVTSTTMPESQQQQQQRQPRSSCVAYLQAEHTTTTTRRLPSYYSPGSSVGTNSSQGPTSQRMLLASSAESAQNVERRSLLRSTSVGDLQSCIMIIKPAAAAALDKALCTSESHNPASFVRVADAAATCPEPCEPEKPTTKSNDNGGAYASLSFAAIDSDMLEPEMRHLGKQLDSGQQRFEICNPSLALMLNNHCIPCCEEAPEVNESGTETTCEETLELEPFDCMVPSDDAAFFDGLAVTRPPSRADCLSVEADDILVLEPSALPCSVIWEHNRVRSEEGKVKESGQHDNLDPIALSAKIGPQHIMITSYICDQLSRKLHCHSYNDSKAPAFKTNGRRPMSFDVESDFEPMPLDATRKHPDIYFDALREPLEILFGDDYFS